MDVQEVFKIIASLKVGIIGDVMLDTYMWGNVERILQQFEKFIEKENPGIVILEDYNKGVLTEAVIRSVISTCRKKGILTAVDPKRKNFFAYKHADLFKPNLKEAKEALNIITPN